MTAHHPSEGRAVIWTAGGLDRVDKDTKAKRDRRIKDRWLACHTQQEIADAVGWSRQAVTDEIGTFAGFGDSAKIGKSAPTRACVRGATNQHEAKRLC